MKAMNCEQRTYIAMALDPIHIGSGGYQLGRVDNSIVREPGTNLPKIPGTSLSGATRTYAALRYEKPTCAGQGQRRVLPSGDTREGHCGQRACCPICYSFGHTAGERSYAGILNFYDAQILLFPIFSMYGPVWVTTEELLNRYDLEITPSPPENESISVRTTLDSRSSNVINLGSLLFNVSQWKVQVQPKPVGTPDPNSLTNVAPICNHLVTVANTWENVNVQIRERIVVIDMQLFSMVVNSNLEIRTSVSIDPETGAAEEGALFTYEAIPRGTLIVFDIMSDDYENRFPQTQKSQSSEILLNWSNSFDVAEDGLRCIEYLGVGGMGTRGFGKFRTLNLQGGSQPNANSNDNIAAN